MVLAMLATQLAPLSPFFPDQFFFFLANNQLLCASSASQDTDVVPYYLSVCKSS